MSGNVIPLGDGIALLGLMIVGVTAVTHWLIIPLLDNHRGHRLRWVNPGQPEAECQRGGRQ
jgi:hypothetical protein